jgi:hypothetical protein
MKNIAAKCRELNNPYASWVDPRTGWEFQLLKSWQADNSKEYGRWFMAVRSPATFGSWELGDGYLREYRYSIKCALDAGTLKVDESVWSVDERGYSGPFAAWVWGER